MFVKDGLKGVEVASLVAGPRRRRHDAGAVLRPAVLRSSQRGALPRGTWVGCDRLTINVVAEDTYPLAQLAMHRADRAPDRPLASIGGGLAKNDGVECTLCEDGHGRAIAGG